MTRGPGASVDVRFLKQGGRKGKHMGTGETEIRQIFEAPQDVQKNYETLSNLKASQSAGRS